MALRKSLIEDAYSSGCQLLDILPRFIHPRDSSSRGVLAVNLGRMRLVLSILILSGISAATPYSIGLAGHGYAAYTGNHVANIHWSSSGHGSYDEDFCYQGDGVVDHSTLKSYLQTALILTSGSWDGTGSYNIDLWATGSFCADYTANNPDIEIWYTVSASGACGGFSCLTSRFNAILSGGFSTSHYGSAKITLKRDHIEFTPTDPDAAAKRNSVINHETGHAFGLLDPLGDDEPGGPDCAYPGGWYYGSSVMHQFNYYGCPSSPIIQVPTAYDKDTVVNGEMISH